MSAPDPAAALRAFVAAKEKAGKYREPPKYITLDYINAAEAMLEHVERLEAALVNLLDEVPGRGAHKKPTMWPKLNAAIALGREIAGRKP